MLYMLLIYAIAKADGVSRIAHARFCMCLLIYYAVLCFKFKYFLTKEIPKPFSKANL